MTIELMICEHKLRNYKLDEIETNYYRDRKQKLQITLGELNHKSEV
jgi:hypothetical protein